jgi:pantoate--beta-alanine ligase
VVKRMVCDLGLPIEVVVCPTVREPDGLAMSSRNAYLSAEDRGRAAALFESLTAAGRSWQAGEPVAAIEQQMRTHLTSRGIAVEYAAVVDRNSLEPLTTPQTPAIAIVAGRIGKTRLIDNHLLPSRSGG